MDPTVTETAGVKAARASRALWLWLPLLAVLGLAFLADGPVMTALWPLYDSELSQVIRHSIRWLGIGYVQAGLLFVLILVGWVRHWPHGAAAGAWALLSLAISGIAADVLKVLVHRPRPYVTLPPPDSWMGYWRAHEFQSFPSGESTTSFAIAASLSLWFPRLQIPLLIAAAIVAIARVIVGNHHPSDIVAGAMLGIATAQAVTRLARKRARQGTGAAA